MFSLLFIPLPLPQQIQARQPHRQQQNIHGDDNQQPGANIHPSPTSRNSNAGIHDRSTPTSSATTRITATQISAMLTVSGLLESHCLILPAGADGQRVRELNGIAAHHVDRAKHTAV